MDEIEEFLTGVRHPVDVDRILATVMFSDIVDSTQRAAEIGDRRWRDLLESIESSVERELTRFRGRAVKNLGDGFLATFDGPARGIRCATAIRDAARSQFGLEVRSGLHTGEIEAIGDDVGGIAVHIGARVGAAAAPGEVLVSSTVKDLVVGSGIDFEDARRARAQGRARQLAALGRRGLTARVALRIASALFHRGGRETDACCPFLDQHPDTPLLTTRAAATPAA